MHCTVGNNWIWYRNIWCWIHESNCLIFSIIGCKIYFEKWNVISISKFKSSGAARNEYQIPNMREKKLCVFFSYCRVMDFNQNVKFLWQITYKRKKKMIWRWVGVCYLNSVRTFGYSVSTKNLVFNFCISAHSVVHTCHCHLGRPISSIFMERTTMYKLAPKEIGLCGTIKNVPFIVLKNHFKIMCIMVIQCTPPQL